MLKDTELRGLSARVADCLIKREGLLTARWSYDYGVVWRGMEALYARTGDKKYFDYIKNAMDTFVGDDGDIRDYELETYNLDYICDGRQLLFLYRQTGEEKYRRAADTLRKQLAGQPRTSDGGFWHKKCYPYQMWLDGLHMAAPFYAEYALRAGDGAALTDAARQLILAYAHTLDEQSGLNRHAWDESRAMQWADRQTGRAAHAWGRAIGWYMAGLVDTLEFLPRGHELFGELQEILQKMSNKMLSVRVNGVWEQVIDCPGRPGNYLESSGSCLMTYAMLKGARLGLLSARVGEEAAESYRAIVREFIFQMLDGRVFLAKCCRGAGLGGNDYRDGSFAYYVSEPITSYDLKGTGAFIQAACEWEMRAI